MKLKELNTSLNENVQSSPYNLLIALDDHFLENSAEREALGYTPISKKARQPGELSESSLKHAIAMLVPHGNVQGKKPFGLYEGGVRYSDVFKLLNIIVRLQDSDDYKTFKTELSNAPKETLPASILRINDSLAKLVEYSGSLSDDVSDITTWLKYTNYWSRYLSGLISIVQTDTKDSDVNTEMDVSLIKGCLRQLGFKL